MIVGSVTSSSAKRWVLRGIGQAYALGPVRPEQLALRARNLQYMNAMTRVGYNI